MAKKNLVKTSDVAVFFGVTSRQIAQLVQEGILTAEKEKNTYYFNLLEASEEYIKYLSSRVLKQTKSEDSLKKEKEKLDAETTYRRAKAKIADLELKELEGKMHRAEDVEAMTTDLVLAIRSAFMALPGRLATKIIRCKTAAEAAECIKVEVFAALEELSNHQYDPAEYRRRVRERQGWRDRDDPEE